MDSNERVVVSTPGYLKNFTTILASEPKRNIANYMLWRAARASIGFLNKVSSRFFLYRLLNYRIILNNWLERNESNRIMSKLGCTRNNRRILKKCNW